VEKILYQGKSPYQEVLVFEVLFSYWYQKYKLPLASVLYNLVIFVCSRQPMAKSLCLMVLFNWLIRMNVHTRKWLLTSHSVQFHPLKRYISWSLLFLNIVKIIDNAVLLNIKGTNTFHFFPLEVIFFVQALVDLTRKEKSHLTT